MPMPSINFNLKSQPNKSGETLILVFANVRGQGRIRKSTGLFINPKQWDQNIQRVKRGAKFQNEVNNELNHIESQILLLPSLYRAKEKELTFHALEEEINKILKKEKITLDFFKLAERMKKKHELVNPTSGTPKMYTSTIKLVKEYLEYNKQVSMAFDDFTHTWFSGFFEYCLTKRATAKIKTVKWNRENIRNLSEQSYASRLKVVKTILFQAEKEGCINCMDFKHLDKLKYTNPDADHIYLTETEIEKLFHYKFSNEKYGEVRDILLFMCSTGLRISDIYKYKVKDKDFINVIAKKTKKDQDIPYSYNPIAVSLLKKYKDHLPKYSSVEFNHLVKLVCKEAGIEEWPKVSAHTGRRSLATNLFKRGWPLPNIMQITGHTREEAFLSYIRMKKHERAMHVLEYSKQNYKKIPKQ